MADKITLPKVSDDDNRTLNLLLDQLDEKSPRNLLRQARYDQKHIVKRVGRIIPPEYYRLAVVLGWTGKGVDSLARRCNLDTFVWPGGDLDSIGAQEAWDENWLGSEVDQALVSSLIHSVAFAVTTNGEGDEPPALLHFKDALNATGEWNPRRRRLDNLLSIIDRDADDGRPTELALYLDGRTIVADRKDGRWKAEVTPHSWGVPADPIVYKPRLGRPFGSSRISRAAMSYQDQATQAVIRMEGHMDVFSFPDFWLLGADESIFKNPDGSQKSGLDVMMGRVKGIPDDDEAEQPRADVKQFPASSPEPHLKRLNAAAKGFAREMSLPDEALAISEMANPTSEGAYTASREDLVAEAEGATGDWSPGLRRAYQRLLAMRNGLTEIPDQWRTIDSKWRSPLYLSRAQEADAGAKQVAAIPWLAETSVGLELLGLDEQQIKRAVAERRQVDSRRLLLGLTGAGSGGDTAE